MLKIWGKMAENLWILKLQACVANNYSSFWSNLKNQWRKFKLRPRIKIKLWYNFGQITQICKNLCSKQAKFGDYWKNRRIKNPFWLVGVLWSHLEKPKSPANYFGLNGLSP